MIDGVQLLFYMRGIAQSAVGSLPGSLLFVNVVMQNSKIAEVVNIAGGFLL